MALFGKTPPRAAEGETPRATPPAAPSLPWGGRAEPPSTRTEARTAVIGPHVRIHGELKADEDVVIEGRVEGEIAATKLVRVGANAQVNAEVQAQTVIIAGRVVGNVTAVERVELLASGSLEGNIRAPKIVIAEGAQFKGSVDMGSRADKADKAEKAATPAAAAHAPAPPLPPARK